MTTMDYKYIEQLLQRYWDCAATVEEERVLRAFFSQEGIPAGLRRYRVLFGYAEEQSHIGLGDDFDRRVLAAIGEEHAAAEEAEKTAGEKTPAFVVEAHRITLASRLRPLFRAAAAVSIVTLLGLAAQHSFGISGDGATDGWDYNQAAYKDSYQDPEKAYEAGMKALNMFKQGPKTAVADSAAGKSAPKVAAED